MAGVLNNINYLVEISDIPCTEPDIWLSIRAARDTLPPALIRLFVPGCSEIMQARLGVSPVGRVAGNVFARAADGVSIGRRGKHGRRVGAAIAGMHAPTALGGRQFLYRIGFFHVQRLLWWWLVADVLTEFAASWTSAIYEAQGCPLPDAGGYQQIIPPFIYGAGQSNLTLVPELVPPCIAVDGASIIISAGCRANITWSVDWEGWPDPNGPVGTVTTWLQRIDDGAHLGQAQTDDGQQGNGSRTGGFTKSNNAGQITDERYRLVGVFEPAQIGIRSRDGVLRISATGNRTSTAWGCRPKTKADFA